MTGALLCFGCAILVAPHSLSRARLATLTGAPATRRRRARPQLLVVCCVPAYFVGGAAAAIAALVLTLVLVDRRARAKAGRKAAVERRKLVEGMDIVIGELRVGAHPSAACEAAAQECAGIAADALSVAAARSKLGGSGAIGIRRPETPIGPELDRLADAWSIAEQHGLALAEILTAAREDVLGRIRFRGRTEAGLAGARATGAVLAGLPVLGIALGQLMGAAPLAVLCGGGVGGVLLVVGTAFVAAGLRWTDAIVGRVLQ